MPITRNRGHSKATLDKADGFKKIIGQLLQTVKVITNKPENHWASKTFQYIDANAGTGYNSEEDIEGSPVLFLKAADEVDIPYKAYFIEIVQDNSAELSKVTKQWRNHEIFTADNRVIIPTILEGVPKNCYGVLYSDPNGIPDFEMLAEVSQHPSLSRVDILIRYAASSLKRNRHNIDSKKMLDYLAEINKKHWIVREMERGDGWQWTFLLGLNWDGLKDWKSQGFHYAHSKQGKEIVEKLNYTRQEIQEMIQPPLFDLDNPPQ